MLALIVSYILLAYLLVPRAIFRSADIFLPLKFQRTRTAEVTFAFLISFIPLVVAVCLSVALYGRPNHATLDNYRELFAASYSEASFDKAPQEFWRANQNVMVQQWEFLGPYYILVLIEACGFVLLLRKYG